jgi:hypothetical protein
LAAEWPLLAQTLGLGYRDQWTRQHRFPTAEFVADDQGVTATVAAIAGAGLTDYQRAATYLGRHLGLRHRPGRATGTGTYPATGTASPSAAGTCPDRPARHCPSQPHLLVAGLGRGRQGGLRPAGRGLGVGGRRLAGFGKTTLVAHLLGQLVPSPAIQFMLIDGKGGPDYDRLFPRAWLSAKDDLNGVRDVLRQVHRLMVGRQGAIAQVLG